MTTNSPAKAKPFGMQLCDMGRPRFLEMISLEFSDPAEADRELKRWENGIRQRVFRTPALAECNPGQLLAALAEAWGEGFESAPNMRHFSLVPFRDDVQMIPSAQGYIYCADQSGEVEEIRFDVLYRCDAEEMQQSGQELFDPDTFEPTVREKLIDDAGDRSAEQIVGAWCAVKLKGQDKWRKLYMLRSEIEKHRKASKAPNSPAWKDWYKDMAIKTVVKKLCRSGRIPMGRKSGVASGAEHREEIVLADVESIVDERPDTESLISAALEACGGLPPTREETEEDLARLEEANELTKAQVADYAERTYGEHINELHPALLWQVARDVEAGKVTA